MIVPGFDTFYKKTKDIFDSADFNRKHLMDIYNACLTNLVYVPEEDAFKNIKNNKEYVFDEEKLQFYPKSLRLHDWDMFVEFDEANSFRVTIAKDDDLIIMGGHAKSHNVSVVTNPINLDYKWIYYMVIPKVIKKLKKVKQYDDYGELIELNIKDACTWLQDVKDVNNIFKIEVEGNNIDSLDSYKTMHNYLSYLDETIKLNYVLVTLDSKLIDKCNNNAIDYDEGFSQAISFAQKYYKEMINKNTDFADKIFRRE